ncbi:cysteine desulfurase family protein [Phytohabitans sp. LJ34]|uniref:cysteine desulfurase family protein n=1 Tax=Phytohabitans sp. LJ34 TaxID=3452217 RepID=UPI003F8CEAEB
MDSRPASDGLAAPRMPVYLDHNATTPVDPAVVAATLPYLTTHFGNPSSGHRYGLVARQAVDEARQQTAGLVGCDPKDLVFVGSGSEANNLALRGAVLASASHGRRTIVTQATEHPSVLATCAALRRAGVCDVVVLDVDAHGLVDVEQARSAIDATTLLVSIQYANGETGTIQPIAELARLAHKRGALFHTDACQAAGKISIDVAALEVDLLSLAGHKMYAPKGIAALVRRHEIGLDATTYGGGQEGGLRSGTENVPYIAGLGRASVLAKENLIGEGERLRALRDLLYEELRARLTRAVHLNGHPTLRLPNTLNISIEGVDSRSLLAATPQVAASTGSACHTGTGEPSGVLMAMRMPPERAAAAVRLSAGRTTTEADVRTAVDALVAAVHKGIGDA